MISLNGTTRIFVCRETIDMRKGFEGLSSSVELFFNENITSGAYFVFFNRPRDRVKILYWDGDGLAIWYKRLERGSFARANHKGMIMTRREFLMLLEGVEPKKLRLRYKIA